MKLGVMYGLWNSIIFVACRGVHYIIPFECSGYHILVIIAHYHNFTENIIDIHYHAVHKTKAWKFGDPYHQKWQIVYWFFLSLVFLYYNRHQSPLDQLTPSHLSLYQSHLMIWPLQIVSLWNTITHLFELNFSMLW